MNSPEQLSLAVSTQPIKIYERTYELPVLNSPGFSQLQEKIKARQQLIKAEKRRKVENRRKQRRIEGKAKFFGFFREDDQIIEETEQVIVEEAITFEERFQELEILITDYDRIINFLSQHKETYQVFFVELTDELKGIVRKRCEDLARVEQKRLLGLEDAEDDPILIELYQNQQQQIFRNAFVLYRAAQLMLKKVDLINKSIQKLAEDQVEQKQLLMGMVGKLKKYEKAYALQVEINQIERKIQELAEKSINFESIMQDFLGPFQGLIEQLSLPPQVLDTTSLTTALDSIQKDVDIRLNKLSNNHQIQPKPLIPDTRIDTSQVSSSSQNFEHDALVKSAPKRLPLNLPTFSFETITVNSSGKTIKTETKTASYFREDLGDGVTLDMVSIPGGEFMMGTEEEEIERLVKKFNWEGFTREKPQHQVTVKPLFMGKFLITQAQWQAIASRTDLKIKRDLEPNPSRFKGEDNLPVERVSWYDAVEFCARLSKLTKRNYRLPSEAEWEYACRADPPKSFLKSDPPKSPLKRGTLYPPFYFGETITADLANYDGNYTFADEAKGIYRHKTTAVGTFYPNSFGLYDMHGNLWEWCADPWHDNYQNAPNDGSVWDEENNDNRYQNYLENIDKLLSSRGNHVVRGASWGNGPHYCRSADRLNLNARDGNNDVGFRVVSCFGRTS